MKISLHICKWTSFTSELSDDRLEFTYNIRGLLFIKRSTAHVFQLSTQIHNVGLMDLSVHTSSCVQRPYEWRAGLAWWNPWLICPKGGTVESCWYDQTHKGAIKVIHCQQLTFHLQLQEWSKFHIKLAYKKIQIYLLTSRFTYPPIKFCMKFASLSDPKSSLSDIAQWIFQS